MRTCHFYENRLLEDVRELEKLINKFKRLSKPKKSILITLGVVILAAIVVSVGISFAELLDNDVRVAENSDLTYYLDVIYDGKDSNVVTSSDTATANVNSDYIYVEDKIPDGLTFKEIVSTGDGTIGAVRRSDGTACPGQVVGGVAGVNYDEATRVVSFRVKNLQAGCKLTVGIVTTTPSLNGKKRMDFYNTATARENTFSATSNTVHVFMGKEDVAEMFTVNYQYSSAPDGAPTPPAAASYTSGASVGVANEPTLQGYDFSGWTPTEELTITNGSFEMPAKNVTFTGSFTKKPVYKVTYSLASDTAPEGYMVPKEKEYGPADIVVVDSLKAGDIVNGFRFLGWTNEVLDLDDGTFPMPEENVELVGNFERVSYKVSYQFQGADIPDNADSLLPAEASYYPGDEVTVAEDPSAAGYKFLGWYSTKKFEMPEEDVVVVGEWMREAGSFTPTIEKTIPDKKAYYKKGEVVTFNINVTNTAAYPIKDVLVQDSLDGTIFVASENYEILSEQFVKIATIPAGGSVMLTANYTAKDDILKEYTNTAEITGAVAEGNNNLDTTKEYKATEKFNVSNVKLKVVKLDEKRNKLDGAEFTLYADMSLTSELGTGLEFDGLVPDVTYYLKETKAPTGYKLLKGSLKVTVGRDGAVSIEDYEVNNENGVGTVEIVDEKINILPETGGIGNIIYIVVGIIIIGVGSFLFILHTKKKDKVKKK